MKTLFLALAVLTITACGGVESVTETIPLPSWSGQLEWPIGEPSGHTEAVIDAEFGDAHVWGLQMRGVYHSRSLHIKDRTRLRADISWDSNTAQVDLLRGVSLNLAGKSVKVSIVDESVYAGVNERSPFTVTWVLIPSPVSDALPATRTLHDDDPARHSAVIRPPAFASSLSVVRYDAAAESSFFSLEFDDADIGIELGSVYVDSGQELQNYVFPREARVIQMNEVGTDVEEMTYIFNLDL